MIKKSVFLALAGAMSVYGVSAAEADTLASVARPGANQYVAEEIVAVVGNSIILLSDLEYMSRRIVAEEKQAGVTDTSSPMVKALENMLMQKLLANQARQDSLQGINMSYVTKMVDRQIEQMISEAGSVKLLEQKSFKPIYQIKDDVRREFEEGQYAQLMQEEIKNKVKVTPSEIEKYYRKLDKDSLPMIPEQYIYAQIAIYPPSTDQAKMAIKEEMLGLRQRLINGDNFAVLARMYSQDGSAVKGGELDPMPLEGFVGPFASALESLKPGQISEVVETEFGFHIMELLEKRGNLYRCRHILMKPKFSIDESRKAFTQLDSIVVEIKAGKLTFEKAALEFSGDKSTKLNGGVMINSIYAENYGDPKMASNRFFKDELMPADYNVIRTLKPGDISTSFESTDMKGNMTYKIIKLNEIVASHRANIKDDYTIIEQMALNDKRSKSFEEWLDKKIASMYIRIDESYRGYDFLNKGWVK